MLQQTQVSTVLPYFDRFLRQFATLEELAHADEQDVLRLWQGLGYYSRARNLLKAARKIVAEHDGVVPRDVAALLELPGVGRYTAGAIASLAYDTPAPIVDGNVARVLCRLDCITASPKERSTQLQLWQRAEQIIPRKRCGDFNSALMELGSLVCTPRSPNCPECPIQQYCLARARGVQDQIPAPQPAKQSPIIERMVLCIAQAARPKQKWLIEQRPQKGRWAGMWQFVTAEANGAAVTSATVRVVAGVKSTRPRKIAYIEHALSHRKYRFTVYLCRLSGSGTPQNRPSGRRWVHLDDLHHYPLPRPHARIAEALMALN